MAAISGAVVVVAMPARGRPTARLFLADRLRLTLIILVVLHHLAVSYAANARFYYREPAYNQALALIALVVFQLFNQAYFMGVLPALWLLYPRPLRSQWAGDFLKGVQNGDCGYRASRVRSAPLMKNTTAVGGWVIAS